MIINQISIIDEFSKFALTDFKFKSEFFVSLPVCVCLSFKSSILLTYDLS